jgi:hypothetical protein
MTGIRPVGRTHDGSIVAVRGPGVPKTGPIEVTIVPVESTALRLGALVSIVSAVLLLAMMVWALGRVARGRGLGRDVARLGPRPSEGAGSGDETSDVRT